MIWKVIAIIIGQSLWDSIEFDDVLHRFREHRGMVMDMLYAKTLQPIVELRQKVLYEIFLDIQKAYDVLDRGHALAVLEGYGVFLQV